MRTMFGWARLSFRLQRLEILLLTAAVLGASGLMLWLGLHLNGLSAAYPDCDFADPARSCRAAGETFGSAFGLGELIIMSTSPLTFGVALFLGVPLVAREVERGTAQLAWTIGPSRVRWLIGRVAFAALVGVVLLGLLAVMTDLLAAAMRPEIHTSQAFWFYGGRGPLLVGRGMLALGAGVLIGAVLGKQLPALLLAALAIGGMTLASEIAFRSWHEAEAVVASPTDHLSEPLGISSGIELPSGERVGYGGAEFQDENGDLYANEADFLARRNSLGREYQLIIPGRRYNEIVARETAVLTGAGVLLIGGAAVVTSRRRPT
ncbi:MAG: hypothetical protein LC798_07405 [Chloroflexi bacterium]|nr:hypothetical protein [Chloroflexota bacterium]